MPPQVWPFHGSLILYRIVPGKIYRNHLTNDFRTWPSQQPVRCITLQMRAFWNETIIECSHIIGASSGGLVP